MAGQKLSHYSILEKTGAGGMGVIYRARDENLQRDVALKVLPPDTLANEAARARLLNEARTASALNHPHICTIYEVGEADGQAYIAMEHVKGQPLSALIPPNGLPIETVLDYGTQTADALAHAHAHDIVHRDLKSSNVMITPEGQVKLVDFGLAKQLEERELSEATRSRASLTEAGAIAGTLPYMAPEVLSGEPADARSDIWGLGVLLYEMATGTLPFTGRTGFELSTAILREPPAPLPPQASAGLRFIIQRCLAKQPGQRYQHSSEVRAALEALHSDEVIAPPGAPAAISRPQWQWVLASGLAIAAVALVAILSLRNRSRAPLGSPVVGGHLSLVVSSEGEARDPALSPDGKMIAYVAGEGGRVDLYVSRVAGGGHVRLTNDDAREDDPAFSPDSERIAFIRLRPEADAPELCVIPSFGGEVVPLIPGGTFPAWSADGARLAFVLRKPGEEALATAAVDGTDLRVLLRGDAVYPFLRRPAWSPDGSQIAVVRSAGGMAGEIWLVPSKGGPPRRLSKDSSGVFSEHPFFAADGRGVVHESNRAGATNLWLLPLDGKPPVRLTSGPGPDTSPSVARDGTVAFLSSRSRTALLLHRLDTGETRTLFTHSMYLWAPVFSPDGHEIAFSRAETDGSWRIWIVPAEGGTPRQITAGKLPEIYPHFTPDGSSVVFFTWGPEPHRIFRVPHGGGPAIPVLEGREVNDAYGEVSPDGRWLAYARTEAGTVRVYIAGLAGGEPRRLTESPATVPRWSPDGKWIAFSPERSFSAGIYIIRADGTGLRRLSDTGGWPVWWPDGKRIAFQAIGPDGIEEIHNVPFEGGPSKLLAGLRFNTRNNHFDISRDATRLVTTNAVHVSDEIWLLEPPRR